MVQRITVTDAADHIFYLSTAGQNPTGQENNTGMIPYDAAGSGDHLKSVPKSTPFFVALFFILKETPGHFIRFY